MVVDHHRHPEDQRNLLSLGVIRKVLAHEERLLDFQEVLL
jgi:hypothetical protein